MRDTSSDTRGLTPARPSCDTVWFGGRPSRIADAGEICPRCGCPVCASNPKPYVTSQRFASVSCSSTFFCGTSPFGFCTAATTSLNSARLYRWRCVSSSAVWSSGSPAWTSIWLFTTLGFTWSRPPINTLLIETSSPSTTFSDTFVSVGFPLSTVC